MFINFRHSDSRYLDMIMFELWSICTTGILKEITKIPLCLKCAKCQSAKNITLPLCYILNYDFRMISSRAASLKINWQTSLEVCIIQTNLGLSCMDESFPYLSFINLNIISVLYMPWSLFLICKYCIIVGSMNMVFLHFCVRVKGVNSQWHFNPKSATNMKYQ